MYIINISETNQSFGSSEIPPLGYKEVSVDDFESLDNEGVFAVYSKLPKDLKDSIDELFQQKIDLIEKVIDNQDIITEEDLLETSSINYFLEDYENDFDILFPDEGLRIIVTPEEESSKPLYNIATMYFNEVPNAKYNAEDFNSVKECFCTLTGYSLPESVQRLIEEKLKS